MIPFYIFLLLFAFVMLAAVGFNNQFSFKAYKVHDEWTDRLLPSELQAFKPLAAKSFPQLPLRVGHPLPQPPSDRH